ncbi:MAG: methylmalonyl Co-A mutase-associated GTPase MeaB [Psychroflexus sp.]|uniref:Methylmalonyl Co-A mutase-associated GTPase MeaB n=1 Tax=Mesohalobacter halotolerans TaxID=1883405 RepID=A0A4U5TP28_9FLAO|nr:methylmalonyl Co-A mutase-associated GTPase MeaB [Psychroflexus sp.]TKS55602.1 methylmalonyl Co-A mutase-associated GTPase MeaB [Mesohalobacter halotolerans]
MRLNNHINPKYKSSLQKRKSLSTKNLLQRLINGDKVALSQSITLIESEQKKHQKLVDKLITSSLPHSGQSIRIGITGVPGVGKSTFIEAFGKMLIRKGKRIAVLAVDPTSSVSKGSILGDKTRMQSLVNEKNAFIRPTASGSSLGGVARKTRENIILCEAAGYDVILVETVGVGQSETAVHSMTDFFLLLKLAGAGDELQGIKRGIIEMADVILINKADGENQKAAKQAQMEFKRALHLYPEKQSKWAPKVKCVSSLNNDGIGKVWDMIESYKNKTIENGFFHQNRFEQQKFWLYDSLNQKLKQNFYDNPKLKSKLKTYLTQIEKQEISSFKAADELYKYYLDLLNAK